jgi:hypothetical protein
VRVSVHLFICVFVWMNGCDTLCVSASHLTIGLVPQSSFIHFYLSLPFSTTYKTHSAITTNTAPASALKQQLHTQTHPHVHTTFAHAFSFLLARSLSLSFCCPTFTASSLFSELCASLRTCFVSPPSYPLFSASNQLNTANSFVFVCVRSVIARVSSRTVRFI